MMTEVNLIRVLLVDDHAVVRQGLRMFLSLDPELEVIGEASDGNQGLDMILELKPDVVLLDMELPGIPGNEIALRVREQNTHTGLFVPTGATGAFVADFTGLIDLRGWTQVDISAWAADWDQTEITVPVPFARANATWDNVRYYCDRMHKVLG